MHPNAITHLSLVSPLSLCLCMWVSDFTSFNHSDTQVLTSLMECCVRCDHNDTDDDDDDASDVPNVLQYQRHFFLNVYSTVRCVE